MFIPGEKCLSFLAKYKMELSPHLHNLHMQQAKKATSESKSHCVVNLGFVLEGSVVQLQLP